MRTMSWRGTLTAQTSIAHGGRSAGTVHQFRRETLVQADGSLLPGVPLVSGSVIRGQLRRTAAEMTHGVIAEITGSERQPFQVVHALRTGGSLRERRAGEEPISGNRQAELRSLLPMLGLFGASVGTRIMAGRLVVDKGLPVSTETQHLADYYGVDLDGYNAPTIWRLVQRETYARHADVTTGEINSYISLDEDVELPRGGGQMQWSHETLPMGTRLFHALHVAAATPVEQSFMMDLVSQWSRDARIGGQIARGMGRVSTDYTLSVTDVTGTDSTIEPADWRQHMLDHSDDVVAALDWM